MEAKGASSTEGEKLVQEIKRALVAPQTLWRHLKTGGLYIVIGEGHHSETMEDLVFYVSVQDASNWVRPKEMFYDGRFVQL